MDFGTGIHPVWAFITAVVGGIATYFTKKSSGVTAVKIAEITAHKKGDEAEQELLKTELAEMRDSYIEVKAKYEACQSQATVDLKTMVDYRNLIRHYKFIFKLIYKQIVPHLDQSSPSFVLLEEVKEMFREDFTL